MSGEFAFHPPCVLETVSMIIKAVIFDFGQTLVNSADGFRAAEKQAETRLFANLGLSQWDSFLENYRRLRRQLHERSNFSRKALWQEVYHYYCLAPDADLLEKWESEYWQTVRAHTVMFPEAGQVLETLRAAYKLALITNTQGQQAAGSHRLNLFPELEKYFKVIIVAGEDGVAPKPDPQPFRLCLQALGLKAPQAVYVGDDLRIDIDGARAAGLHPVWLRHHSVRRKWPAGESSVPVIARLDELLELDDLLTCSG